MYPNVKAEIARRGLTLEKISGIMGISISTLSGKLNGKYPFSLNEAKTVKTILGVDMPLEELFREAE